MPDVTADNLSLDEATDGLPVDAAADNTAKKITCTCNNKMFFKAKVNWYSIILMRRDQNSADDEININR